MDPGVGSCQRFCFKLMNFPVRSLAQGIDGSGQDSSVTSVSMQRVSVESMSHCWSSSCSTTVESISELAACTDVLRAGAFRERYGSQTGWISFEGTFTLKIHLPQQTHTSTLVYVTKTLRQPEEAMQSARRAAGTETVARMCCRGASPYTPTAAEQPGLQKHKLVSKITNNWRLYKLFFSPPANTTFASIMHPDDLNL